MASEPGGAGAARYDPGYVRRYYDALGEREWERFERGPADRVNLHLHLWHLRRHIRPGQHVLDVGAGPGRFTIELARLGARVTVGDLSPVQLELNRRRVQAAGAEGSVVARPLSATEGRSPTSSTAPTRPWGSCCG